MSKNPLGLSNQVAAGTDLISPDPIDLKTALNQEVPGIDR